MMCLTYHIWCLDVQFEYILCKPKTRSSCLFFEVKVMISNILMFRVQNTIIILRYTIFINYCTIVNIILTGGWAKSIDAPFWLPKV